MSAPTCIRLAVRACRPAKISSPAVRYPRRFLASTQHYRDDSKVDIKAGFPSIPISAEDGSSQPVQQVTPDTPPKRSPRPAASVAPRSAQEQAKTPVKEQAKTNLEDQSIHTTSHGAQSPSTRPRQSEASTQNAQTEQPGIVKTELSTMPQQPRPAPQEEQTERPSTELSIIPQPSTPATSPRLPLNVVAAYHRPLKHDPTLGVRVASLQLRSYSVRNLEFMCDFALRAAYFLGLPASGPVPLPKKIERWTVPRSNFVHKKSQENFERITRRRAIQILDGHKDVVQIWLAYLRKHQFYGVGMKADVWEFEEMDVASGMDAQFQEVERELDEKLSMFGWNKHVANDQSLTDKLRNMGPGQQTGASMQFLRAESRSESRL